MHQQFVRGQKLLSIVIGFHLLVGILTIASYQSFILPGTLELLYRVTEKINDVQPVELARLKAVIQNAAYQQAVLAQQGQTLAFHIFWCSMLYLGFNWVRVLLGLSWLLASSSFVAFGVLYYFFQFVSPLILVILLASVLYTILGGLLLFSPAINTYMRTMRR
jgi:hypothetical protein